MGTVDTSVDNQKDLTVFIAHGEIDIQVLKQNVLQYYTHQPTKNVIWDMTQGRLTITKSSELREVVSIAKQHSQNRKEGRTAIVSPDDTGFGLGRMYGSFAEIEGLPYEYGVFRDMQSAAKWIGID